MADRWVRFECSSRILHNGVLHGRVASIVELNGLVDGLVDAARWEGYPSVAHLDHRDEGLGAGGEGVAR